MSTVVFDLDGTLADTSGDLLAAANAVFRAAGHGDVLSSDTDRATALRGGRAMLTLGYERLHGVADPDVVSAGYPDLLAAYADAIAVHTTLYPHAMQAVFDLQKAGYLTSICTNKPEGLAETLLCALGVRDHFSALIGADTLPVRKPDPDPLHAAVTRSGGTKGQAVLIGDTITDRDTAVAAGIPCVLVDFGPGGGDIAALKPEAILSDFRDLPAVVSRLLPLPD